MSDFTREQIITLLNTVREQAWLFEVNLSDLNLDMAGFQKACLRKAELTNTSLKEASLKEAELSGANLNGAQLCWANLYRANLGPVTQIGQDGSEITEMSVDAADLSGTDLEGANLREANLHGVTLNASTNLNHADLRKADISGLSLEKVSLDHLQFTLFEGAYLEDTTFPQNIPSASGTTSFNADPFAELRKAKLIQEIRAGTTPPNCVVNDLIRADLRGAEVGDIDLSQADLRRAQLQGADLRGVKVSDETNLHKARFDRTTKWPAGLDATTAKARGAIEDNINFPLRR